MPTSDVMTICHFDSFLVQREHDRAAHAQSLLLLYPCRSLNCVKLALLARRLSSDRASLDRLPQLPLRRLLRVPDLRPERLRAGGAEGDHSSSPSLISAALNASAA